MFVFYDWPFPHMCTTQRMQPISLLILGSVFSDCVVFYGDCFLADRSASEAQATRACVLLLFLSPRKRGIMFLPALVCLSVCLFGRNFLRRFLGGKASPGSFLVTTAGRVWRLLSKNAVNRGFLRFSKSMKCCQVLATKRL